MRAGRQQLVKISKALGDETRFRIFHKISQRGEMSCKEVVETFHVSQPTISHHLRVLVESGLLRARKEGQWTYFSIKKKAWEAYLDGMHRKIRV